MLLKKTYLMGKKEKEEIESIASSSETPLTMSESATPPIVEEDDDDLESAIELSLSTKTQENDKEKDVLEFLNKCFYN